MTGFTDKQIRTLADVLDAGVVKKRQQASQTLFYIEAWRAIDEANRIFGFDGWRRETVLLERTVTETFPKTRFNERAGKKEIVRGPDGEPVTMTRVGYLAKVRVTVEAGDKVVVREGTGYGSGIAEDPNMAFEGAAKQAESDAMKRALMTFGNPFGLALYDKRQANVDDGPSLSDALMVAEATLVAAAKEGIDALRTAWSRLDDDLRPALKAKSIVLAASITANEKAA